MFLWWRCRKGVCVLVGVEGKSGSLGMVQFTHWTPGVHQLRLGLLLPMLHVPVCRGYSLLMLLGCLLHLGRVHFQYWGLGLVAGTCREYTWILVRFEGRLGFLDSTSIIGVGVHVVWGVFWRVVSVSFEHLNCLLSECHPCSNPSGLAVHDGVHVALVLGLRHGNPLGLGVLGLGGDDLGGSGCGVQRPGYTTAIPTCPWSC